MNPHPASTVRRSLPCRSIQRVLGACLCLGALAGCATQTTSNPSAGLLSGATPVGQPLSGFLDNATPGSATHLTSSVFGSNVDVTAGERYFSASGHTCLHLDVAYDATPSAREAGKVACYIKGQGWFAERLVTEALEQGSR